VGDQLGKGRLVRYGRVGGAVGCMPIDIGSMLVFVLLLGCAIIYLEIFLGTSFSWYWFFPFRGVYKIIIFYLLFHFWCVDGQGKACLIFFFSWSVLVTFGKDGEIGEISARTALSVSATCA